MSLNARAFDLCQRLIERESALRLIVDDNGVGPIAVDCGIEALGSLEAGIAVSEICMSGLGSVSILSQSDRPYLVVQTMTDQPVVACLASQYAGWMIKSGDYFAMGSGPMRAAAGKEELFDTICGCDSSRCAVGVLESRSLPPDEVRAKLVDDCGVDPRKLVLLVAPTASLVGTMQIVARSVEAAVHKLHELGFDVAQVKSGLGTAPLPPLGGTSDRDDAIAMGRTNDAILYGADVTLWCDCPDETLEQLVRQVPSSASSDYGRPFAEIFAAYDHDFYKIDKMLFSPAVIALVNLRSGRTFRAGQTNLELLDRSFEA